MGVIAFFGSNAFLVLLGVLMVYLTGGALVYCVWKEKEQAISGVLLLFLCSVLFTLLKISKVL